MRQLKPDKVLVKSNISNYRELEKSLHFRYKKVRIPQTEYFRLNSFDIRDCKRQIKLNKQYNFIFIILFIRQLFYIFVVFSFFIILNGLIFYDWSVVILNSLDWTKKASFLLMIFSFIKKSGKRYDFLNEFIFRIQRSIVYLIYSFFLSFISQISQYYFLD